MTLFKKVFQSQSQPVNDSDASDFDQMSDVTAPDVSSTSTLVLAPEDIMPPEISPSTDETDKNLQEETEAHSEALPQQASGVNENETEEAETENMIDVADIHDVGISSILELVEQESECDQTKADPSASDQATSGTNDLPKDTGEPANSGSGVSDGSEKAGMDTVLNEVDSFVLGERTLDQSQQESHELSGERGDATTPFAGGGVGHTPSVTAQTHVREERSESDLAMSDAMPDLPTPVTGRAGRPAGRVRTRLLGFNREPQDTSDPFQQTLDGSARPSEEKFPVGWLVVIDGPGRGYAYSVFSGASTIGRGEDQVIRLDFGDNSISRQNHAAIAYDEEVNKFYIGHGGKSNIIRRNARPVLSTEELHHADLLRIGETTLRFVALCGSDFQWNPEENADASGH